MTPARIKYDYPFTEEQMQEAAAEWFCNCGPSALAFALQIGLDKVRGKIPGFETRHYTSPTMMKAALRNLGVEFDAVPSTLENTCDQRMALVRVQWTGPWTAPGANPKWAYRQTHWIATYRLVIGEDMGFPCLTPGCVFDCNGGMRRLASWETEIVPILTKQYPRADGGWYPTHIWRLKEQS